jgi:nucleoside-diphosphate-sugar epimerase
MTVLVTGAAGFVGRRVVVELLRRGYRTVCMVRSPQRLLELDGYVPTPLKPDVRFVTGQLTDGDSCRRMLEDCDGVVHLAARLTGSTSSLFLSAVVATRTLVDAAIERGTRRFVMISSLGVYGTDRLPPHSVVDEACPIDPKPHLRDAYTYSKIEQERVGWAGRAERGLPLVVVRPGVVFGPGRTILCGRVGVRVGPVMVRMGGARIVPYTYVDNCASAIASAVDVPGVEGHAFNVVDDQLPTARDTFRAYTRRVGPVPAVTIPQWAIPTVARAYEWCSRRSDGQFPPVITRYRAAAQWKPLRFSNDRAKRVLGWHPSVPFADALDRTLSALQPWPRSNGQC